MLTKYATGEVIEVKSSQEPLEGKSKLSSFDHLPGDTFRTDDGYLYVKVRAISSRVNKNFDGWPVNELAGMDEKDFRNLVANRHSSIEKLTFYSDSEMPTKGEYGFKTFKGRPNFVDHNNTNPLRARGVVVDAILHIENPRKYASDSYWSTAPQNHLPETWVELLIEVDADRFPKYAQAWREGKINAVSMGCNVDYTKCSICQKEASNLEDFCEHIRKKGSSFKVGKEYKTAYEDCYGINFFEISGVFDPADVTALLTGDVITKQANTGTPVDEFYRRYDAKEPMDHEFVTGLGQHLREPFNTTATLMAQRLRDNPHAMTPDYQAGIREELYKNMQNPQNFLEGTQHLRTANEFPSAAFDPGEYEVNDGANDYADFADKAFELGVAHHHHPQEPEMDLQTLADILGVSPHDNQMHQYLQSYESGLYSGGDQEYDDEFEKAYWHHKGEPNNPGNPEVQEFNELFHNSPGFNDYNAFFDTMGNKTKPFYHSKVAMENTVKSETYRTLKDDKKIKCPIGMDDNSCGFNQVTGICDICDYKEPPEVLGDPDLSRAKQLRDEQPQRAGDLLNEIKQKVTRTLTKTDSRSVNSQMDRVSKITLSAEVDEVPSDEKLEALGWSIPGKEAGAAAKATAIAESGKAASDQPRQQKVLSDQKKPVESSEKTAVGEKPGLDQPTGGESSPQYKGDFGTAGINDHQPGSQPEQYSGIKHPVEAPQWTREEEGKSPTEGIKEHSPGKMEVQYSQDYVEAPQWSKEEEGKSDSAQIKEHHPNSFDPGTKDDTGRHPGKGKASSNILASLKLAELEIDLGLTSADDKFNRIAQLEEADSGVVQAQFEALSKVKQAGLKKVTKKSTSTLPSFKAASTVDTDASSVVPDDGIFF